VSKHIEIRCHAARNKPDKHISQTGITLARHVGEGMSRFDTVISSTQPRSFETAIAMGFAVNKRIELIESYGDRVEKEIPWPQPFSAYQAAYRANGAATGYMKELAAFYTDLAESLPEQGSALIISHGGIVEMSAVTCLPDFDFSSLGDYLDCCEGVRLTWDDGRFVSVETLRVPMQ
jgi:broad specificity phosphatase PhoE